MGFQVMEGFGRSEVLTVKVGDRDAQNLAGPGEPGEPRFRIIDAEIDELAQELEVLIPQHRSRKQPQLQEHLETVSYPKDQAAAFGEFAHFLH
jgi:hypothetical protein